MNLPIKIKKLLTNGMIEKINQVAYNLNIDPVWLTAVMYFESGKTFSPSKTNNIGSVGLIQFTRDKAGVNYKTIQGKRYNLSDLAKMSFNEQMNVVQKYYEEVIKSTKKVPQSFIDTYLVTFFPLAVGKDDNFVFESKCLSRALIAKQNPIFDLNKDGKVTKKEVETRFAEWFGSLDFSLIDVKKKTCSHPQCPYYQQ